MNVATIDNKVRQVVSNIRNLPTPPIVFHQIQNVINDPGASAGAIAGILAEDPAMSMKVLKLTNSAFYGLSREIESVKQAVVIVGMEAIKNLVLSASVLDMFRGKALDQDFQEKFWRHSLATAFGSRLLANRLRAKGIVDADAAFSAGLLHDIGKMIICCFLPVEYQRFTAARDADRQAMTFEIEERALGYNHTQIGAVLATQWKLPFKIMQAVTYHHHPQLSECDEPIAYVVHIANFLAKRSFFDRDEQYLVGDIGAEVREYMEIDDDDIEKFSAALREEYLKSETFMQMVGLH